MGVVEREDEIAKDILRSIESNIVIMISHNGLCSWFRKLDLEVLVRVSHLSEDSKDMYISHGGTRRRKILRFPPPPMQQF